MVPVVKRSFHSYSVLWTEQDQRERRRVALSESLASASFASIRPKPVLVPAPRLEPRGTDVRRFAPTDR
jgi:hypothetical protein